MGEAGERPARDDAEEEEPSYPLSVSPFERRLARAILSRVPAVSHDSVLPRPEPDARRDRSGRRSQSHPIPDTAVPPPRPAGASRISPRCSTAGLGIWAARAARFRARFAAAMAWRACVLAWNQTRHGLLGPLIEALLPADCPGCDRPLPGISRGGVCDGCWSGLKAVVSPLCPRCGIPHAPRLDGGMPEDRPCGSCLSRPPVFDGARCALVFEGAVRALVHLFKFDNRRDLARPLARSVVASLPEGERFDLVVPVPIHWTRRLARGYNQAALLARRVARATRTPLARGLLVKRRRTPDQSALGAAARRPNVRGAFIVRRSRALPGRLQGLRILLVDDIVTTGATASECARVLKSAGAASVFVAAVARTPLPGKDENRHDGSLPRGGGRPSRRRDTA